MSPSSKPRPMTAEDLWSVRRVGAPAASPDGGLIVVPVTTYDIDDNKPTTRLYRVVRGEDPVPLTASDQSSSEPALSPDGSRLAFVRKTAVGETQLAVMSLEGGEAEVLTDFPLGVSDPRWFPDGRRIAFLGWVLAGAPTPEESRKLRDKRKEDPVQAHVTENRIYRFWDTWLTDGKVPHLFVLDLETRKIVDLIPESTRWFDFMEPAGSYDISPDGAEIVFSADSSAPPHSPTNWDVFVVSATGGEVRNITSENPADDMLPRYSPDGKWIVYGMQRRQDFYADRVRLVAYDRREHTHHVLTEDWDRSAAGWEFIPGTSDLVITAEDIGRIALYRMDLKPGEPKLLCGGGTYAGVQPLGDGRLLAAMNTISEPVELVEIASDGAGQSPLTEFNREFRAAVALGEVRDITYPGSDDREIQAYVVLPPGFDPKKKWPLVEVLHGGPHGISADNFHFRWNLQLFAAQGYVVLAPNFHGSTSWGQDFAASILGEWGPKPFQDSMAGVDALVAEGYIDEARMAAVGASYGGYLVTWIAGHTDRFACIVNHAGVADTMAEYASDVTYGRDVSMGGEPWDNIEGLDRMNPMRFADGFTTPMLVVHGERDYRVPVTQGLSLYNILKAKGVPARLLYFPDENHWVLKPQNAMLWHREVYRWLERWLKKAGE